MYLNLRKYLIIVMISFFFLLDFSMAFSAEEKPQSDVNQDTQMLMKRRFAEKLDQNMGLNKEQYEKLKKIRNKYEDKREDLMLEVREKKMDMIKLLKESEIDRKKVDSKLEEMLHIERERQKLFLDEFFEVRDILTPDQIRMFTRRIVKSLLRN